MNADTKTADEVTAAAGHTSLARASLTRTGAKLFGGFNYLGFGFVLLLILLWEVCVTSGLIKVFGLPAFSKVAAAFFRMVGNGQLFEALLPSLQRWAIGYTIAVVVGVLLGMLMGYFKVFYKLLEPITELVRPIPSPAYVPVAILFLGIDDAMKIFVIAFASMFSTMISTYSGVRSIDAVQMGTAKTFGISRFATIFHVVLPAAAPYILSGMRISLAVSLILTVIAEMIAGNSGIGYAILVAQRGFQVDEMYAGIIALGIVGYALNRIFLVIESALLKWHLATAGHGK
jgi:ABC-type nitrate/sulfonate/bicarbonate transport system permease component